MVEFLHSKSLIKNGLVVLSRNLVFISGWNILDFQAAFLFFVFQNQALDTCIVFAKALRWIDIINAIPLGAWHIGLDRFS